MSNLFSYYNPNPELKFDKKTGKPKKWHKDDCVIRAFCCALNLPWDIVFSGLCKVALRLHDMPNSNKVIEKYAEENDMIKMSLPDYMTVSEFAMTHDGIYICNIRSHVSCIKHNQINDTWNCGRYRLKTYYYKK